MTEIAYPGWLSFRLTKEVPAKYPAVRGEQRIIYNWTAIRFDTLAERRLLVSHIARNYGAAIKFGPIKVV